MWRNSNGDSDEVCAKMPNDMPCLAASRDFRMQGLVRAGPLISDNHALAAGDVNVCTAQYAVAPLL